MDRIGAYAVVRELIAGPGLVLAEGVDPTGQPALLQIVRCRAVKTEAERESRYAYERGLAQATAEWLQSAGAFALHAHGGADGPAGERWIFWALDMPEGRLLGLGLAAGPPDPRRALELALGLAARLQRRHADGLTEPTLCEHLVLETEAGGLDVAGVPVSVGAEWLALDVVPARRAPEEGPSGRTTPLGDLWRLGRTLDGMLAAGGSPPEVAVSVAEALSDPDPDRRPSDAVEAVRAIRDALVVVEAAAARAAASPTDLAAATDPTALVAAPTVSASAGADSTGEDPGPTVRIGAPGAERASSPPRASEPARAAPEDATPAAGLGELASAAGLDGPRTPAPTGETEVLRAAGLDAPALAPPSDPVVVDPTDSLPAADAEAEEPPTGEVRSWPPRGEAPIDDDEVEVDPDPSEAHTRQVAYRAVVGRADGIDDEATAQKAAVAAWEAPVLPVGASPWSEVVSARGTHNRDRAGFEGFAEELPGVKPEQLGPRPSRPVMPPPASVGLEADPELVAATSGFNGRKVVAGLVALLLIFGVFVMLSRPNPAPIAALPDRVLPSANDLRIEVEPAGASVVAALDGRLLGSAPIDLMVPPGSTDVVLVTAPGHLPIELQLPERGELRIRLRPVPLDASCEVELESEVPLEGVGVDVHEGRVRLPGAGIVRARAGGPAVGARIVRCPALGGERQVRVETRPPPAEVAIRLSSPPGARGEIDGVGVGRLPGSGRARGSFVEVEVRDQDGRSVRRWVPAVASLEVHLPAPDLPVPPPAVAQVEAERVEPEPEPPTRPRGAPDRGRKKRVRQLLQQGSRALVGGDLARARTALEQCLDAEPDAADCHRVLGAVHSRAFEPERAREHFRRYLELRPEAPDADTIRRLISGGGPLP